MKLVNQNDVDSFENGQFVVETKWVDNTITYIQVFKANRVAI